MSNQSLSGFCKANGFSKTTVHRFCQSQGIDTSSGLSPEDCSKILKQFKTTTTAITQVVSSEAITPIIENPLDSYNPLQTYEPQQWSYTDTSELVEMGKQSLAHLTQSTTNNQNLGISALIEHEKNEGAKLGMLLAQVKLGTAMKTKDEVITEYLKKQGLGG